MEYVNDRIKDSVDYVVYDNEPSYPAIEEVEKNYVGKLRKNFREDFEEVREYYYRREMGGYANVEEAKNKQKQAAECTGFYDRAGDARYRKETLEDRVSAIDESIKTKEKEITNLSGRIEQKNKEKNILETKKENYVKKDGKYAELKGLAVETIDKDKDEVNFISSQIDKMKKNIAECKSKIEKCVSDIKLMSLAIDSKKNEISSLKKEKRLKSAEIKNIIETQLKPMFEGLKRFYLEQGIKVIKRG